MRCLTFTVALQGDGEVTPETLSSTAALQGFPGRLEGLSSVSMFGTLTETNKVSHHDHMRRGQSSTLSSSRGLCSSLSHCPKQIQITINKWWIQSFTTTIIWLTQAHTPAVIKHTPTTLFLMTQSKCHDFTLLLLLSLHCIQKWTIVM